MFGNSPSPPESVGGTNAVSEQEHQSGIIDLTVGEDTELSDGLFLDFNDEDGYIQDLLLTENADSFPIDGVLSAEKNKESRQSI